MMKFYLHDSDAVMTWTKFQLDYNIQFVKYEIAHIKFGYIGAMLFINSRNIQLPNFVFHTKAAHALTMMIFV